MFSEKNIPKLIIISPIVAIISITFITSYFFISTQYDSFNQESLKLEEKFMKEKRGLLQKEIESVYSYLSHQESIYSNTANEKVIKRTFLLSSRLNQLYKDLNKDEKILKSIVNSDSARNNYFFAYDVKNKQIIQAENRDIKQEFKDDDKFFENYLFSEEGKLIPFSKSNKIVFIQYLPKLDWIIGNIENIDKDISFIKSVSQNYISSLNFDNNGYVWIYKNDNNIINEDKTILKFIEKIIDTEEGVFLNYKNDLSKESKLAYTRYFEKWNWVIGASLNLDDIQNTLIKQKDELEKRVDDYISLITYISLVVMIATTILFSIISNKISSTLTSYQENEEKQKNKLQELNNSLSIKVKDAIKEVQYKERAMFHQSRLARLGSMLSMIAHQWRQPLSEVSSILMELETATKFNKVDKTLILDCTKDADKLLSYMSDTIDDFRTFFKPDKEKELFSINKACDDSISLMSASFKELNITLNKKVEIDKEVLGYPREFSQVILNILSNAKDIFIERETKNAKVDFTITKLDGDLSIIVEDNAGGILFDNIEQIFEPYFSTKISNQATGMGLYMSKMIIENNMNGSLTVSSSEYGTTFKIII